MSDTFNHSLDVFKNAETHGKHSPITDSIPCLNTVNPLTSTRSVDREFVCVKCGLIVKIGELCDCKPWGNYKECKNFCDNLS